MVQSKHTPPKKPEIKIEKKPSVFFKEKPIVINITNIEGDESFDESFTVFMRPLKIKEIPILNRITHLQEKDANDEQAAMMLISLAVGTLDVTSEELPMSASGGIVAKFIEYNFPKDENTEAAIEKAKKSKNNIDDCIAFLIEHNHIYSDILEYPIPHFNGFVSILAEKLGTKKKPMNAADAFRKLNIPVKPRSEASK